MAFFLSYSRADQAMALRIAGDLRAAGVTLWVDQMDIRPSDRWDRSVEAALHESAGLVLIMSPRSVASENVADEISVAMDAGKPIVPVMIEACRPPLRLARVQFIDATGDYGAAMERCKAAIAQLTGQGGAAPAAPQPAVPQAPAAPIAPDVMAALVAKLTPHLGPVAKHLVEHESRNAASLQDLVARLAQRIPDAADRDVFAKAARTLGL